MQTLDRLGDEVDPPLTTPEGGDVYIVASGWRLALREFADNRLALVAGAVLLFFVLFCFVGPLFYHTNQTISNPLVLGYAAE